MNWTTFDGKEVSLKQIPHSHLSNIVWFGKIFGWALNQEAVDELYNRFGGKILPYSPHPEFKAEWRALERKSMVTTTTYGLKIIVFEGQVIGYVWDEVKNASSILKFEPRKLVGFTRLARVPDGTKVVYMITRELDRIDGAAASKYLEKGKTYEVGNCIHNPSWGNGQSWIKLKEHPFYHPVQKFAQWVNPKDPE